MSKFLILMAFAIMFFLSPSNVIASEQKAIGTVTSIEGYVSIKHKNSSLKKKLSLNDPVHLYDFIETGKDSLISFKFDDGTTIDLGEKGNLSIDEYIYNPETPNEGSAKFKILETPFIYISGRLGKAKKHDVSIDFDRGSIGVRGTKIVRDINWENHQCLIYLEEGKITVRTNIGSVNLDAGQMTVLDGWDYMPTEPKTSSIEDIARIRKSLKK